MNKRLVTNSLKDWLWDNGFKEHLVLVDSDESFFDSPKHTIIFGFKKPSHIDTYASFCRELGLNKDVSWPVLTFLHELGHGETSINYTIRMLLWEKFVRKFSIIPSHSKKEYEFKTHLYYNLLREKEATKWSIDYINNNDVSELEDILECLEK